MISHASKVLLKIIQERIREKVEFELDATQVGFRAGRGTRDHLCNLRSMTEGKRPSKTALPVFSRFRESLRHSQSEKALEDVVKDGDGFRKTSGRVDAVIV